jgi:transcriptional regulator with XRE-family HTH domain
MTRKAHTKQYKTVAEAMRELGYTDQRLADEVKCDRTWITRVRQGRPLKTLRTPIRIARALNVPIEALAGKDAA